MAGAWEALQGARGITQLDGASGRRKDADAFTGRAPAAGGATAQKRANALICDRSLDMLWRGTSHRLAEYAQQSFGDCKAVDHSLPPVAQPDKKQEVSTTE